MNPNVFIFVGYNVIMTNLTCYLFQNDFILQSFCQVLHVLNLPGRFTRFSLNAYYQTFVIFLEIKIKMRNKEKTSRNDCEIDFDITLRFLFSFLMRSRMCKIKVPNTKDRGMLCIKIQSKNILNSVELIDSESGRDLRE